MSASEHRRDLRVTKGFMARYRLRGETRSEWRMSPLKDLSRSGARFLCEHTFAIGDVLDVKFLLPVANEPVAVMARVVWVRQRPAGLTEHGVLFTLEDPSTGTVIEQAVLHALKRRQ